MQIFVVKHFNYGKFRFGIYQLHLLIVVDANSGNCGKYILEKKKQFLLINL